MGEKFQKFIWYLSIILSEQSTWRGIAFIVGLFSGHGATGDWGQAAAIGGSCSALLKIFLPDSITKLNPKQNEEEPKP